MNVEANDRSRRLLAQDSPEPGTSGTLKGVVKPSVPAGGTTHNHPETKEFRDVKEILKGYAETHKDKVINMPPISFVRVYP